MKNEEIEYFRRASEWDAQYGEAADKDNVVSSDLIEQTIALLRQVHEEKSDEIIAAIIEKLNLVLQNGPFISPRPQHPKDMSASDDLIIIQSLTEREFDRMILAFLVRVELDEDGWLTPASGIYERMVDDWQDIWRAM